MRVIDKSNLRPQNAASLGVLNDLDLSLVEIGNEETYYPNGLTGADDKNNAERVRIDKPVKGSRYTIRVEARQLVEPQVYSLAATGCLASAPEETTFAPSTVTTLPPTSVPTLYPTDSELLEPAAGNCEDTQGTITIGTASRST